MVFSIWPTVPPAMMAAARMSSAKVPTTKRAKLKTADRMGDENDENNNDNAVIKTNCSRMKYNATRMWASAFWKPWYDRCDKYRSAAKNPNAIRPAFTVRVPTNPRYLPRINSHRRTGRDRIAYRVRLSISFETSAMPIKIAITTPNSEMAVNPMLMRNSRSISIEIWPSKRAEPEISTANRMRL